MQIFVGNLALDINEAQLLESFKVFGEVRSVEIKRELFTGASRGFGFIEMPGRAHSLAAIMGLNGKDMGGQPLRVSESKPMMNSGRSRRR
jgi:RNA recognition motif-containing protein